MPVEAFFDVRGLRPDAVVDQPAQAVGAVQLTLQQVAIERLEGRPARGVEAGGAHRAVQLVEPGLVHGVSYEVGLAKI